MTQLRILCQMEGGQCCHPYAVSTFYLKNSTCKWNHTGLLCYLLLEFLWTCFLIFPAQPLPWQLVSSPAKLKNKSFKMLLFFKTISLYSCVRSFFSNALNWYHQAFLLLYTLSHGLIQNFRNNEVQRFKRKVLSSTLYCAPIHYAVQLLIPWIKSLRAIKEIYWAVLFCGAVNDGSNFYFWEWNFHNVTIEIKANVHYFSLVLFTMFFMVMLHVTFYPNPFKSTLTWNHLFSTTLLN